MGDNNAYREFWHVRIEKSIKFSKHTLNFQNFPNFLLKYPLESLLIKFVLFPVFRPVLLIPFKFPNIFIRAIFKPWRHLVQT